METGICNTCSSLKFLRRIKSCSKIRNILKNIVKFPSVNGKLRLSTYGIDEIGDVPRLAFVIRLPPRPPLPRLPKRQRKLLNKHLAVFPHF